MVNDWNRLSRDVESAESLGSFIKDGWMSVWIGRTGGMDEYWIIPRVMEKELPCVIIWPPAFFPILMFLYKGKENVYEGMGSHG